MLSNFRVLADGESLSILFPFQSTLQWVLFGLKHQVLRVWYVHLRPKIVFTTQYYTCQMIIIVQSLPCMHVPAFISIVYFINIGSILTVFASQSYSHSTHCSKCFVVQWDPMQDGSTEDKTQVTSCLQCFAVVVVALRVNSYNYKN